MPAVTRSSSDGILSRISNNSTQLDEKWDCNERKQWVIKNFESIGNGRK